MGKPNHFPANPNRFEFDAEVTEIFPDMARRSIPQYLDTHAMHVGMLRRMVEAHPDRPLTVLDIGASRGEFLTQMTAQYPPSQFQVDMLDGSPYMVDKLKDDFPFSRTALLDLETYVGDLPWLEQYDVVVLNYVLQFLPPEKQHDTLSRVKRKVRPGGVLIYGGKEATTNAIEEAMHEQYLAFRVNNGYSEEEIRAKTTALKRAMWPPARHEIVAQLRRQDFSVTETARYTAFASYFCVRGGWDVGFGR